MKKYIILLSILILAYCGGGEKKTSSTSLEQDHEVQAEEGHEHQELHLSPEKQREWGIEVGTATMENIVSKITLPGILTLNQNKTAHISSFVQGKVVSLSCDLGDRVAKGQVSLTIISPEFAQAQADFLRARAKLNLSRKEYERAKMLLKEKAIEEKEYLRREAEHETLSTEYGALGSALHSYGINHNQIDELIKKCESMVDEEYKCEIANPNLGIISPISGIIIFRDTIVGEHIEPNKILFTVSNLSTLWAVLDAYERDLPFINKQSKVLIKSLLYPEKEFVGKIAYISDLIDEKLRTIKIRVEVKNENSLLKPNMYIQGLIENKAASKELLSIPDEAIQNLNGEKIVFVLGEKNVFAIRHVELGKKVGKKRIIASGLKIGEKIVIKGAFNLKAELSKAAFGDVHVH